VPQKYGNSLRFVRLFVHWTVAEDGEWWLLASTIGGATSERKF